MKYFLVLVVCLISSNIFLIANENCNEIRIFPLSLRDSVELVDGEECIVFRNEANEMVAYACPAENACVNRTRIEPDLNSQVKWQFPAFDDMGVIFKILPPKNGEEIPFMYHVKLSSEKSYGQIKILWKGKNWIFRIPKGELMAIEEVEGNIKELTELLQDNPDYDFIKAFQYFIDKFPELENISQYFELARNIAKLTNYLLPHEILDLSKFFYAPGVGGWIPLLTGTDPCMHCKYDKCDFTVCALCGGQTICNDCNSLEYCHVCCMYCHSEK